MKPWKINLLIILVFILMVVYVPNPYFKDIVYVIIFASALWAGLDAKKLNISKYKVPWFFPSNPGMVSVAIIFLWLIYLPLYISYRHKIVSGKIPLKNLEISMPQNSI